MFIQEIWRYPVKSMAGERLQTAQLTPLGITGDRTVHIETRAGRTATSRTFPGLLGFKASVAEDGTPLVDGRPWHDAAVLDAMQNIVGPGAKLVHDESADRFDILPLLVATDGAIAAFGRDLRRLRPNIVIAGVPGLEEREWEGGRILIGNVTIGIQDLRGRCIMTTFDPDTLAHDPNVLRDIVNRFGGKLALNCDVLAGGEIHTGQELTVTLA